MAEIFMFPALHPGELHGAPISWILSVPILALVGSQEKKVLFLFSLFHSTFQINKKETNQNFLRQYPFVSSLKT